MTKAADSPRAKFTKLSIDNNAAKEILIATNHYTSQRFFQIDGRKEFQKRVSYCHIQILPGNKGKGKGMCL